MLLTGFLKKLKKLRTLRNLRKFRRKNPREIRFNEIIDDILGELLDAREKGEIERRAEELERQYSRLTGFNVKIEADECGATIWINDLQFDYEFTDEGEGEGSADLQAGARENRTEGMGGFDDLSYIR